MYCSQYRALLDTLCIQQCNRNTGQIILHSTLLIGHTQQIESRLHAHVRMAVCVKTIAQVYSPGQSVYTSARSIRRRISAQDGKYLVLQAAAPVQNTF